MKIKSKAKGKPSSKSGRSLGKVQEAANRTKDREWLKIQDGETVVLRVLDTGEDFLDAYVHRVPVQGEKGTYYLDVPCLDQDDKGIPCPGCKDDLPKRYKFWVNVIVRDVEDDKGKAKDKLMIWGQGITIAKRLNKMHQKHGLDNRDIEVEREGSTKDDTSYNIDWADEEDTELTADDEKIAKQRFNLTRYATPPEFDDFYKNPSERGEDSNEEIGKKALKRDAFGAKKKGASAGTRRSVKAKGSSKSGKVTVKRRK